MMMETFDQWWAKVEEENKHRFLLLKAQYGIEAYNNVLPLLKEMAKVGFEAGANEAFNFMVRAKKGQ